MAKIFEGAIKLASTIQQTGAQPLDDRVVVAKVADLYDSFGSAIYNGMVVAVTETNTLYILMDKTKVASADGWKEIGSDVKVALSAENYTASKALATADNVGQIISVTTGETIEGVNYTSGLYIVTGAGDVAKLGTTTASGDIAGDVAILKGDVSTLKTTVVKLDGDKDVEGSVKNQINTVKTDLEGQIKAVKDAHTVVSDKAEGHVRVETATDETTRKQTVTISENDIASADALAQLSIKVDAIPAYKIVSTTKGFELKANGEEIADSAVIAFKDFMVKSGEVVKGTLSEAGEFTPSESGKTYIHLVLNIEAGTETNKDIYVEATSLVDTYTVAEGSEGYVSINGYKIGLTAEFIKKINKIDTLETTVGNLGIDETGKISAEKVVVKEAIADGETELVAADTPVNTVIKSIYDKIKAAETKSAIIAGTGIDVAGSADGAKTVSVKLETASDTTVKEGHIELKAGDNGLYAQMYYMEPTTEPTV